MEGGFFDDLRQLEFFPGAQEEKRVNSYMPVVSTSGQLTTNSNQGIYQDEESVDFSALLEAYNPEATTVTGSSVGSTGTAIVSSGNSTPASARQEAITSNSSFQSFRSYLTGPLSLHPTGMYGSESFHSNPMQGGQVEMSPSPPSIAVDCIPTTPSPHVVQIESNAGNFTAMRPAPGKAQRLGKQNKKHSVDKNCSEYRQKRDRNNVAVRKSREKSKYRVMDTEKRVKELEDENSHLQSKIALLSKELNVLKSLFTSAGVSQPPSFHGKAEGVSRK